jgi:hypothetical protein
MDADSNWASLSNLASGSTDCGGFVEVACSYDMLVQEQDSSGFKISSSWQARTAGELEVATFPVVSAPLDSLRIRLTHIGSAPFELDAVELRVATLSDGLKAFRSVGGQVLAGHPSVPLPVEILDSGESAADFEGWLRPFPDGATCEVVIGDTTSRAPLSRTALVLDLRGRPCEADSCGALEILVPDASGGWMTRAVVFPEARRSCYAVDSIFASRVRLRAQGAVCLGSVRRLVSPFAPELTTAVAQSAQSGARDVRGALGAEDGEAIGLSYPASCELVFPRPSFGEAAFVVLRGRRATSRTSASQKRSRVDASSVESRVSNVYPNPFEVSTRIDFALPTASDARLEIYDVNGRRMRILLNGRVAPGPHSLLWDGRDADGFAMPAGVYAYRLRAGQYSSEGKVVLVR